MADWSYAVGDAATVKLWSHKLFAQAIQRTTAWKLASVGASKDSPDNILQILDDTQKTAGDSVKYHLIAKLIGAGVQGDGVLTGQEESLNTYQDILLIDQLRHSVLPVGAMSQQRVPWSMREVAKNKLADWWAERMDLCLINQLTGNTVGVLGTDTRYTGNNATVAPTATSNWIYSSVDHSTEATLDNTDLFSFTDIDKAVAISHTATVPIKPIRMKGMEIFGVCLIHPYQARDLRTNTTDTRWQDFQKAAMNGGQITGNPIFSGALGMYNNVVIHEDARMPWGGNGVGTLATGYPGLDGSGNQLGNPSGVAYVARGVFVGAQAACMAFGRAYGLDMRVKWFEELLDGGNQLRISAGMIYGVKKTIFNSADYATITISSYTTAS